MSVFNYLEGIPSREDVIEEDGTLIKDYMSSLEYKPTHKKHVKATLKMEGFKSTQQFTTKGEETLKTQITYDEASILNLLNSLEDEIVDVFLEGISFVASKKQSFSYSKEENSTIINAMMFHTGFKHPCVNGNSLRQLYESLLSTNENVDKINKLIKLLSN